VLSITEEIAEVKRKARIGKSGMVVFGNKSLRLIFIYSAGFAFLLDPTDALAEPLVLDSIDQENYIEDSSDRFAVGWSGTYAIEGNQFLYTTMDTGKTDRFDMDLSKKEVAVISKYLKIK